jgi:hypothetical protein
LSDARLLSIVFANSIAAARLYMPVQKVAAGLYGLGMLLTPTTFSAFCPWKLDDFRGQMYGDLFFAVIPMRSFCCGSRRWPSS